MQEFISDLQSSALLQHAVAAAVLASVACGVIGSYVSVKRISYMAGAIAHCTLGGMGLAGYLNKVHNISFMTPMTGALIAALAAAFIIGWLTGENREREDTVLSAVWSVGMAIGIFFIYKTPGYNQDLMSYLFGNILMVSRQDLYFIAILDGVILLISFLFYKQFLSVCFDEQFAKLRGLNVSFYRQVLLCLTALTVVLLTQVVGIVMVIALLSLPAAAASNFSKSLFGLMSLAVLFTLFCTLGGLVCSYIPDLPSGATIVLFSGLVFIICTYIKKILSLIKFNSEKNSSE